MTGESKMTRPHSFELTIPMNATDHLIGPANARITVTEYGDFECSNCKQAAPAVIGLRTRRSLAATRELLNSPDTGAELFVRDDLMGA